MMAVDTAIKISYTISQAAEATGLSRDTIRRAVNSGDLPVYQPVVDGRQISSPLISARDLRRWATGSEVA